MKWVVGVHIHCCDNGHLWFRFYSDSLFQTPECRPSKKEPKGFAPAYGTSLRLSVPSLRCPSGGIAYGLLRCTSSRCMRLRRTALRASPRMNTFARPADGAKDQKPHQDQKLNPKLKADQRPLTLALSQRERGLTARAGRDTPTWDTESNANSEQPINRPPLPPGEGWGEGRIHQKTKAEHPLFTPQ